jgi:AraC-like DNA-binding protein
MDVLSEILRLVKLEGAFFFNAEFSAPWCLKSVESSAAAAYLPPVSGRPIIYHFLTEGRAYAKLGSGRREDLQAGDIVIFPHGDEHFLGNGAPAKPVDSFRTWAKSLDQGLKVARYGGGGERTRFVCGYLACEPRLSQVFLASLPKMLKVSVANDSSGRWIENSIRYSVSEADGSGAGAELVLARLSELLFVQTLRLYINGLPADETGWLAGTRDPVVGEALALLHRQVAHPWTVGSLARRAGSSRTRLAERFRHYLGEPPMEYLTKWRLRLGAEMLQSSVKSVAEIAHAVGYGSEAAFNRAFKREYGGPPAKFRKQRRSNGVASSAKNTKKARLHG